MPPTHIPRPRYLIVFLLLIGGACLSLRYDMQPGVAAASTFTVTNNSDSGAGSLRQAILDANANAGADVINFSIGSGLQTISLASPLPEITDPVTIDGTSQPGFAGNPVIEVRVDGIILGDGLTITGGNSTIRGLILNRFRGNAIKIESAGGNVVEGNYIGTNAGGNAAEPNSSSGVFILSSNNRVGGLTAAARNVISGNGGSGIIISAANNLVQGNYIGLDVTGTTALRNLTNGIAIGLGANGNVIGGTTAASRNVISGNGTDILINSSNSTVIQGNYIGTNASGSAALIENFDIIRISDSNNTLIGGPTAIPGTAPGNVIVSMFIVGGTQTLVQGNLVGLDATGSTQLTKFGTGIRMWGETVVGGSTAGSRNVISGFNTGVFVANSGGGSILGNYIGTDITGTKVIANGEGINLGGNTPGVRVGGTAATEANVISGNGTGITISTNSTIIKGNFIGTREDGTTPMPNSTGIVIGDHASSGVIGGTEPGAANVIAFNQNNGIEILGSSTLPFATKNSIRGNKIHSNASLGIDLNRDQTTFNDAGDSDTGPNDRQNFPEVLSVTTGNTTSISGTLNSAAGSAFTLDFYVSGACDDSGFGEGESYLGSAQTNTDGNGTANFNVQFPVAVSNGSAVTATATDANGNTSEFSLCRLVNTPSTVQFVPRFTVIEEQAGVATISVSRTLGNDNGGSVSYSTSAATAGPFVVPATPGTDFGETSGTLNFAPGETIKSFTVPIINDTLDETTETFVVTLSSPTGLSLGTRSSTTVQINDNDLPPKLSISEVTVGEGDSGLTNAVFKLTLSGPSGQNVGVRFSAQSGTAIGSQDFQPIFGLQVTFAPGEISKDVAVNVVGDTVVEPNEFFFGFLTNATNATVANNQGVATIIDDDSLLLMTEAGNEHALTLDSTYALADPFSVLSSLNFFGGDGRTHIMLFATGLKLGPGESAANVSAVAEDPQGGLHPLTVEFVGPLPSLNWLTEVVVKLPDGLINAQSAKVSISLHGASSNKVVVNLKAP